MTAGRLSRAVRRWRSHVDRRADGSFSSCSARAELTRTGFIRAGFTLAEMLLVLGILVIVAAVTMPTVLGSLRAQRLKSASEMMRVEWSRAHVKAMKSGRVQVFRYEMSGTKYSIQPWIAADEATEANTSSVAGFGAQTLEDPVDDIETKELPEGITFAGGDAKFDTRAYEIEDFMQQQSSASEGTQWSRPVLFYPDGSASDAYVIVANDKQTAIRVRLRGLTGTSVVDEVSKLDELLASVQPGEVP
jgi:prepilin-type N-terminal cleavage/methylation domain-containing protein